MLGEIKTALRLTTSAYDAELLGLQEAAKLDLKLAGVITTSMDALIRRAIITYCRMNFGSPEDYDRLKRSYDEQKAQLSMASGYTDWGAEETANAIVGLAEEMGYDDEWEENYWNGLT